MPRSIFMGRVPTPGEPLWLPDDRAWAMALLQVEADQCPDCATPWGEAIDPAHQYGHYDAEPIRCHACAAIAVRVKAFEQDKGDPAGLHMRVITKGVPGG